MKKVQIIRTSASRSELLKASTESILNNLEYSGELEWILHEDVLDQSASNECINYSNQLNIYRTIGVDYPPLGHRRSFLWLFKHVTEDYVIHYEDDYILEKPVDLDLLIGIMEKYPDQINQIVFPKRDILPDKPGFSKIEIELDGVTFTTCQHWMMVPAIWRMSYIKNAIDKLQVYYLEDFHWRLNRILKGSNLKHDAQWVIKNTKTFYLGKLRSGKLVEHIGKIDKSVREKTYRW